MIALLRAVGGLIAWAVAFTMLYAVQGLSCALGWDGVQALGISAARLLLVATYIGWLAALAWLCWYLRPRPGRAELLQRLGLICAVIGLVSTLYTGFPVLATTVCAQSESAQPSRTSHQLVSAYRWFRLSPAFASAGSAAGWHLREPPRCA